MSELTMRSFGKNARLNRWEIALEIKRSYIEPVATIDTVQRMATISNTPAEYDEQGTETTPEGTEVADFEALITDYTTLEAICFNTGLAHAENVGLFVEYVDNTDDLWDGETLPDGLIVSDWLEDEQVAVGFLRKYNGVNYRCIQKHTTQASWTPDVSPSLWVVAPTIGGGGYPIWVQPAGSQDAYQTGDIVEHNGSNWESLVDANVWEPTLANDTLWNQLP